MRKGAVVAIIIIAVLVIAALVGFIVYNNSNSSSGTTGGQAVQQQTGSGLGFEDDQSDIVRQGKEGVEIPGWDKMTVDAGTTDVYVDFYNPSGNEGKYYMTFELRLADTGEVLYTSKMIKPGDHVKQITLNRALEPGTYNAMVHVQPYDADTLIATNNADVKFTLIAA